MFDENDIIELDEILRLVGAFKATDRELRRLSYMGTDLATEENRFKAALVLCKTRAKANYEYNEIIDSLVDVAKYKGIDLIKPAEKIIPKVYVMNVGGSL